MISLSDVTYFESIAQHSPDALCLIDRHGVIVAANHACHQLLSQASLGGQSLYDLTYPADADKIRIGIDNLFGNTRANVIDSVRFVVESVNLQTMRAIGWRVPDIGLVIVRLEAEADQARRISQMLHQQTAVSESDGNALQTILESLLEGLETVVDFTTADIMLREDDRLVTVASRGYEPLGTREWIQNLQVRLPDFSVWYSIITKHHARYVDDVSTNDGWVPFEETSWIRGHIEAPIMDGDVAIGVLNINSDQIAPYDNTTLDRIAPFIDQIGSAIRMVRRVDHEREQRILMENLIETNTALSSTLDISQLTKRILDSLASVIEFDAAAIMQYEDGILHMVQALGYENFGLGEWILDMDINLAEDPYWHAKILDGTPMVISDTRQFEQWIPIEETDWIRSHMFIPVYFGEVILGVINIDHTLPNFFTDQHLQRLTPFVQQAAIALHNARLYESERRQRTVALSLIDTNAALSSSLEVSEIYEQVLDRIDRIIPCDGATIVVHDNGMLRTVGMRGNHKADTDDIVFPLKASSLWNPAHKAVRESPFIISDTQQAAHWFVNEKVKWIRSTMILPLHSRGAFLGFISLDSQKPNAFTEYHLQQIRPFGHQVALAISNAHAYEAERDQRLLAESLVAVNSSLISTLDLQETLNAILKTVAKVVPFDAANVMMLEGDVLRIVGSRGYEAQGTVDWIDSVKISLAENPAWQDEIGGKKAKLAADTVALGWHRFEESQWIGSSIMMPLHVGDEALGAINVDSATRGFYDESHVERLRPFAATAALAIHNAKLFTSEHESRLYTQVLLDSVLSLTRTLDLHQVLDQLVENIGKVSAFDAMNILLYQDKSVRVVTHRGYDKVGLQDWIDGIVLDAENDPIGQTFATMTEPTLHAHTKTHPDWIATPESDWIGSNISLPIRLGDEFIGAIVLNSVTPNFFSESDIERLQPFTYHAAIAIQNARLFTLEREQRHFEEALVTITNALNSTLDLDTVLSTVLDVLPQIVPCHAANVMMIDDPVVNIVAHRGYVERGYEGDLSDTKLVLSECADLKHCIATQSAVLMSDTHNHPLWDWENPADQWVRSHVKAPIVLDEKVVGFLNVDHGEVGFYTQAHTLRVKAFGDKISVALRNARLFTAEREQRQLAEALQRSVAALNQSLDLQTVLDAIITQFESVLPPFQQISISLLDDNGRAITVKQRASDPIYILDRDRDLPLEARPKSNHMSQTREPIIIPDMAQNDFEPNTEPDWVKSYAGIPLKVDEQIIGFIGIRSLTRNIFSQTQKSALKAFAEPAAAAIRNAQLYQQREQERAQTKAILEGSGEGIIYSRDTRIVYVNRALCNLLGYEPSELVGHPLGYITATQADAFKMLSEEVERHHHIEVTRETAELKHKSGQLLEISATTSWLDGADATAPRAVTIVRDIRQERQLRAMQMRFITHATHELRQPIANIMTRLYLLERSPDRLDHHLPVLRNSLERLTNLTEHMSTITELDQGSIRLLKTHMNLRESLQSSLANFAIKANEANMHFEVGWHPEDIVLQADMGMITQMMNLLLSHVLLFNSQGESIYVIFHEWQNVVRIEINGGTPHSDDSDEIFAPFSVASEGEKVHTGLELSIAQRIAQMHGGRIDADSKDPASERHHRFLVTLPKQ